MELGLTIPLQTYLKIKQLEDRTQKDLFFCWELHRIQLQSRDTLVAVNSSNRLAVVMSGMDGGGLEGFSLSIYPGAAAGPGSGGIQILSDRSIPFAGRPVKTYQDPWTRFRGRAEQDG